MSTPPSRPASGFGPLCSRASDSATLHWAAQHLGRVLRIHEGSGPAADQRIRTRVRCLLDRVRAELPSGTAQPGELTDHLWSALLRNGQTEAARFFLPYQASRGPVLWIYRGEAGADPLARNRVERLLDRRCLELTDPDLDTARIQRHCRARLRNGMEERELIRVLSLTSPAEAAILDRLETAA
ncbi:hypothetical protein [Thiohalorhabdus methylotrophus]|uniref:Uncharacterized protein n=1 Tax=Thiohalorhabdus methylotrophus TaxID=3242694 RepID=A0ABV4TVV9_9GAMM